jgi:hypothetical protein
MNVTPTMGLVPNLSAASILQGAAGAVTLQNPEATQVASCVASGYIESQIFSE